MVESKARYFLILQHTVAESPFVRRYVALLARPSFVAATLTLLALYWLLFGWAMMQMEPRLDAGKILPSHSKIQRPNHILHETSERKLRRQLKTQI